MIFKNASDQAERIREALDHLDDVRMPKEAREHLKELRNAVALLVVHTVKEVIEHEPLSIAERVLRPGTDNLLLETSRLASRIVGDAKPSVTLRPLLSPFLFGASKPKSETGE